MKQSGGLKPGFTPLGIWAFSIGTSIGWGSFIVTCNTYLQKSGLLGTVFGLLLGLAVIFVITWNLQYMIRKAPDAGGIYIFEKRTGGKDRGFLAFWFILLTYLAILWANITSVPLFARFFLGDTFRFGFHYNIFGYEVWFGEALLSICSIGLIALLCIRSSRLPAGLCRHRPGYQRPEDGKRHTGTPGGRPAHPGCLHDRLQNLQAQSGLPGRRR